MASALKILSFCPYQYSFGVGVPVTYAMFEAFVRRVQVGGGIDTFTLVDTRCSQETAVSRQVFAKNEVVIQEAEPAGNAVPGESPEDLWQFFPCRRIEKVDQPIRENGLDAYTARFPVDVLAAHALQGYACSIYRLLITNRSGLNRKNSSAAR